MIEFHHIAIEVKNLELAIETYEKLFGLKSKERLTAKISHNTGHWFELGNLELHLQTTDNPKEKTKQHFALLTNEFDEIIENAKKLNLKIEEAKLTPGFGKRAFLYDRDSNRIELLQKI
ncbi:MAG: VOC family protein [Oligoflexia bacterium]|nr:VOC family protein [Oligoflexia bacterium]